MFWGLLFIFFGLFTKNAAAADVAFTLPGGEYVSNVEYTINYQANGLTDGDTYYAKIYGTGIRMVNGSTLLSGNDSWTSFPTISIGASGASSGSFKFKAVDGAKSYEITFSIAKTSNTSAQVVSSPQTITVIAPSATPISPSPTPSSGATPTTSNPPLSIKINAIPSNTNLGQNFEIKVLIENGNRDYEYFVKAYGGVNDNYSIETSNGGNWLNFNSDWTALPKIKTDGSGRAENVLTVRAKSDKETGNYLIGVKAREWSGSQEADSGKTKTVTVNKAPTATLTSKPSPTPTIEVAPTLEPTPTDEAAPTSDLVITDMPSSDDLSVVISPASEEKKPLNLARILPIAFIVGGGLMVAVPLIIGKIKK